MKKTILLLASAMLAMNLGGCIEDAEVSPKDLASPQYSISAIDSGMIPEAEEIHTAEEGVIRIAPAKAGEGSGTVTQYASVRAESPETVWQEDTVATYNSFTMPEKAMLDEMSGSMGVLSIPALNLRVNVYETEDEMEAMERGIAHFKTTSAYDGNVGLSGHNVNFNGTDGYFKNIHTLRVGDQIAYKTALGERTYTVTTKKEIADTDWSYLSRSKENKLTLITCITGKPDKRLVVQAEEK